MANEPYLYQKQPLVLLKVWNPQYDQQALCKCGHQYHRHFDSYSDMDAIGCKYCECFDFIPAIN